MVLVLNILYWALFEKLNDSVAEMNSSAVKLWGEILSIFRGSNSCYFCMRKFRLVEFKKSRIATWWALLEQISSGILGCQEILLFIPRSISLVSHSKRVKSGKKCTSTTNWQDCLQKKKSDWHLVQITAEKLILYDFWCSDYQNRTEIHEFACSLKTA